MPVIALSLDVWWGSCSERVGWRHVQDFSTPPPSLRDPQGNALSEGSSFLTKKRGPKSPSQVLSPHTVKHMIRSLVIDFPTLNTSFLQKTDTIFSHYSKKCLNLIKCDYTRGCEKRLHGPLSFSERRLFNILSLNITVAILNLKSSHLYGICLIKMFEKNWVVFVTFPNSLQWLPHNIISKANFSCHTNQIT